MTKKFSTYIQILKEDGVDHLNHSVKNEFSYMLKEFAAWKDLSPEEKRQRLKSQGKAGSEKDLQQAEGPAAYTPQQRAQAMARGEGDPASPASVDPETAPYTGEPTNAPATSLPAGTPAPAQPVGTPAPAQPVEPPVDLNGDGIPDDSEQVSTGVETSPETPATAQPAVGPSGGKTQGMLGKVWNHLGGDAKDAADFFPNPGEELQTRVNTGLDPKEKAENLVALAGSLGIEPGEVITRAQGIVPVLPPGQGVKNPATGNSPIKGSGDAGAMLKQQNASVDASGDFISEGKFGDMAKASWDTLKSSRVGRGVKNVVQNPGETIKKAGSAVNSLKRVINTVHGGTGGTHGTQGTDLSGIASGKYKGKTAELNTVVNLVAKVLNAKTTNERTTAVNNLNSNPDFQEFNKNKTPQEKQAFLQQITALAQLQ